MIRFIRGLVVPSKSWNVTNSIRLPTCLLPTRERFLTFHIHASNCLFWKSDTSVIKQNIFSDIFIMFSITCAPNTSSISSAAYHNGLAWKKIVLLLPAAKHVFLLGYFECTCMTLVKTNVPMQYCIIIRLSAVAAPGGGMGGQMPPQLEALPPHLPPQSEWDFFFFFFYFFFFFFYFFFFFLLMS